MANSTHPARSGGSWLRPRRVPRHRPALRVAPRDRHRRRRPATGPSRSSAASSTRWTVEPGRPLPNNVEFFAGVVVASAGLPRGISRRRSPSATTVGWTTHAVEQAARGKLIRPSVRYVG
ncbi:MAG: citrate/2-methylcitrate synthase [Ilumatobacteraceae bacterium]